MSSITEALSSIKALSIKGLHFYLMANGVNVDLIGVGGETLMTGEDEDDRSAVVNALCAMGFEFGSALDLMVDIMRAAENGRIVVTREGRPNT